MLLIKPARTRCTIRCMCAPPMTVRGEGEKTILKNAPSSATRLLQDFDLSEYVAKAADVPDWRRHGVTFKDKVSSGWMVSDRSQHRRDRRTIIRVDRRSRRATTHTPAKPGCKNNFFPLSAACGVDGVVRPIATMLRNGRRRIHPLALVSLNVTPHATRNPETSALREYSLRSKSLKQARAELGALFQKSVFSLRLERSIGARTCSES